MVRAGTCIILLWLLVAGLLMVVIAEAQAPPGQAPPANGATTATPGPGAGASPPVAPPATSPADEQRALTNRIIIGTALVALIAIVVALATRKGTEQAPAAPRLPSP